ncbi:hypothetical protein MKX08_005470 [Trichoderma sp. CBMAI-0020]|nr:hypothetical protein MKX08_005470 [Trichoderma sp. CBMAI-0020]
MVVKLVVVGSNDAERTAVSVCQLKTAAKPGEPEATRPQRQGALAAASSTDGVAQDERSTASIN